MNTILAVDDSTTDLKVIQHLLRETYDVLPAISVSIAMNYLEKRTPDLILLDLLMPEMDGRQMMRVIRSRPKYADIPVIFLTADRQETTEAECLRMGAFDFIPKPIVPEVLMSRISKALKLNSFQLELQKRLNDKTRELERLTVQSIKAIADIIDARDSYTKGHSMRVAEYSSWIAKKLGWGEADIESLYQASMLHDVGKIGVPDRILLKNGRLDSEEMAKMREHPVIGYSILKDITGLEKIAWGARCHHERYDGNGYPDGLVGSEIPEIARIIGLADAFDAMSSDRVYRKSLSEEKIRSEIINGRGKQFDPMAVDAFMDIWKQYDYSAERCVIKGGR